jgi:hypothetical protein
MHAPAIGLAARHCATSGSTRSGAGLGDERALHLRPDTGSLGDAQSLGDPDEPDTDLGPEVLVEEALDDEAGVTV